MSKTKKERREEKLWRRRWRKIDKEEKPLNFFYVNSNWPSRGLRGKHIKNDDFIDDLVWNWIKQLKHPFTAAEILRSGEKVDE